jgi:multidrug efflux pump subunit AcrB
MQVYRVGDQSVLDISAQVAQYVEEAKEWLPSGLALTLWRDRSDVFASRLQLLVRNGLMGLVIVIAILTLFLKLRVAFWTSLGIVISFLGALMLMPALDVSLNMMTLFAFILVLGIVVDDAIIVGENIHSEQERTGLGLKAAEYGATSIGAPVIFAILTTITAFLPMVFLGGIMGAIMIMIPAIVIPTLAWSLVESLLILPNHLSHYTPPRADRERSAVVKQWDRFQGFFSEGLKRFIQKAYRPSLRFGLHWRYLTATVFVGLLILTLTYWRTDRIRFEFLPSIAADFVIADVTMPLGTPAEKTAKAVQQLEQAALQLNDFFREREGGRDVVAHVAAAVATQPFGRGGPVSREGDGGSHLGEVNLELTSSEVRDVSSAEIERKWRSLVGRIPEAVEVSYTSSLATAGAAINVELTHESIEVLQEASDELRAQLQLYPGVYEITDTWRGGKQEIELIPMPEGQMLGLRTQDIGGQVRSAFFGLEAQRIQRGRDEVKVMVRYPEAEREQVGTLEEMRVRAPGVPGGVPLPTAAEFDFGRGFATIRRVDGRRSINVTAETDITQTSSREVMEDLRRTFLPELMQRHPGLRWSFEGEERERRESMGDLGRNFIFALLGIYVLLAIPFNSFVQPVIVMSAIPFGFIGAVAGHILLGYNLSMLSMMGVVALAGVVVNDSLIMVDYINRHRIMGDMKILEAVREAGVVRFRPILLTSLTTFGGLTPLLLERSMQARFMIPMAISLAFGVLFATFVTLILVPTLYVIVEDIKCLLLGSTEIAAPPTVQKKRTEELQQGEDAQGPGPEQDAGNGEGGSDHGNRYGKGDQSDEGGS